jgi:hypothetical protein
MLDDDDEPKKTPRATIIRRAILVVLALACTGWLLYTRVLVKKVGLGEPCGSNMHCKFEAPKCLKSSADSDGVCSRACANDGECAEGIKCVKVELEEYDERGRPLEGGYCFPQAILDARKKKKDGGPGGEEKKKSDSWIDVPESPAFEGEVDIVREPDKNPQAKPTKYLVKGSVLTLAEASKPDTREIGDGASFRIFHVDDKQKTFSASAILVNGGPDPPRLTKTEKKERIADRECEIWEIEGTTMPSIAHAGGAYHFEACVVAGASFLDVKRGSPLGAWVRELASHNAFPLRVRSRKLAAQPTFTTEILATKVVQKAVDASLFEVPKSYKNLAPGYGGAPR